ncbi:TonB-dependent receptor plug domain-containing protein [Marinilongibacter aquaticus]|uniref:TonB-dependent receptor plug domain-containing protein n=1 Tax=Marinilongibacter aquaticus TaxID=2975157 RepID=UPI0021BD581E|nr:TonB-dependent receptor plug domain-containing protein [Marinilongibacter aquaticus]UBM60742.1 TonB-dependent receptor plug domain-containing protein [Marinilongibacter aquaticus]
MKVRLFYILLLLLPGPLLFGQLAKVELRITNPAEEVDPKLISVRVNKLSVPNRFENSSLLLRLPKGENIVHLSYTGFKRQDFILQIKGDTLIYFKFEQEATTLEEVKIQGQGIDLDAPQMSVERVSTKELLKLPILMGELDIQRGLQTLSGVSSVGEGANGLNIRGGSTDQNLLLIDNTPIYNPTHLFGLLSVVPSEAISRIDLYKGAIPVNYGGRIASVIDLKTADPSLEKLKVKGGAGLIASKLSIEAPIIKQKLSFQLVGRASFTSFLLHNFKNLRPFNGHFNELYGQLLFRPSDKDKLSLMHFNTYDFTSIEGVSIDPEINNSNVSEIAYRIENSALKWTHAFGNKKLFSNLILSQSRYRPSLNSPDSLLSVRVDNSILNQKASFNLLHNKAERQIEGGAEVQLNKIEAGNYFENHVNTFSLPLEKSLESAAYLNYQSPILGDKMKANLGLRYSWFLNLGPAVYREYSLSGNEITEESAKETVEISSHKAYHTYGGFEPRISLAYSLSEESSLKANLTVSRQYIQIVANNTTPLPVSRWKTSDQYLKPQVGKLYTFGYYRSSPSQKFSFSGEVYFRQTANYTDVKMGSNFLLKPFVETELLQGKNKAYGFETSLNRVFGQTTLNLNYTFSRSFNKIVGQSPYSEINSGNWYRSNFDRPHAFNVSLKIQQSPIHHFAFYFTFASGRPYTAPEGIVRLEGKNYPIYIDRNNARIPAYHRLDFSWLIENPRQGNRRLKGNWAFNVYNLYAHKNIYSIFFNNTIGALNAYKLSVFASAIPSLSYNFTFE